VFQRYVLGVTHAWTEEAAIYAMMWLGLVGAALGLRRGTHIAIAYFAGKVERVAGRAIAALVWTSELLFALFLVVYGWRLAMAVMAESSPGTGVPVGVVNLALPIAGALMLLFLAEQAARAWARRRS
jgi:TRAP-type C4-dicarboxylate transport system permease small subunit